MKSSNVLIIASFIFLLIACHNSSPKMINKQLADISVAPQSWEALQTGQVDSFKILNTGSVKVPLSGMLNEKKLPADHGMGEKIWVEVYVFLFHHQQKGWFMIDTGLDSTFQKDGNIKGLLAGNYIKDSKQEKGQNIAAQLKRENKKIEGIYLTHLHGDHTAGLPEIDSSIPKYCSKEEKHIHIPALYHSNHLSKEDTLYHLDWSTSFALAPFNEVIDVFGDQSFFAIHTPGHSSGHTSYLLNTTNGLILLTGDASHTRYGFENGIEPGWTSNKDQAVESLKALRRFKSQYPDTHVVYGHQQ